MRVQTMHIAFVRPFAPIEASLHTRKIAFALVCVVNLGATRNSIFSLSHAACRCHAQVPMFERLRLRARASRQQLKKPSIFARLNF